MVKNLKEGDQTMKLTSTRGMVLPAALLLALLISGQATGLDSQAQAQAQAQATEKISRFGEYKGYSPEVYDSWVRTSRYLTMRDNVRLAADIIRPAVKGIVEEKPLPAIFIHTRYRRASIRNGKVISEADSPLSQIFLKRGYSLLIVDVRGSGASFGAWRGMFDQDETRDAYEIIEWLAGEPWCDGKIGMSGGSYLGTTQLMAASSKPPHLRALFPIVPIFDLYDISYHGGVFYEDVVKTWSALTGMLDAQTPAASVDDDPGGALLKQALQGHAANRSVITIFGVLKFRDGRDEATGSLAYQDWGAAGKVKQITDSKIPMYIWGGWFDSFTRDVFLMHKNFKVPRKLVVGAWSHSPKDPAVQKEEYTRLAVEGLRWFDYWLKGIDNGILGEPDIRYQVMKAPKVNEWRTASAWPLAEAKPQDYYFQAGSSGSVASVNDGLLSPTKQSSKDGRDAYSVDYTTTSGTSTRWDNAVGGGFGYPDMTANDKKGLTYTTSLLDRDVEVTGHPVVHLWVSSTAADGDFFAYLEEVDPSGASRYITEGALKASHRALGKPAYDYLGLPYHRSYAQDVRPLKPGEAVDLAFDLEPTSNIFEAGNRIRVTIVCADKDNAETRPVTPPPTITVYRSAGRDSRIVLPVVPAKADIKPN
jgi:putative CocE/NonD family hydrolase